MFAGDRNHTTTEQLGGSSKYTSQTASQRNLKQRAIYAERKANGECTRCGVTLPEDHETQTCTACSTSKGEAANRSKRRLRRTRRKRGQCARCGMPSKLYECDACTLRLCRIAQHKLAAYTSQTASQQRDVQGFATVVESDGHVRQRFRGRAKRGRQDRELELDELFTYAISSLQIAKARMREVFADYRAERCSKGEYRARMLEWLGQCSLAERFLDEIDEKAGRAKLERG